MRGRGPWTCSSCTGACSGRSDGPPTPVAPAAYLRVVDKGDVAPDFELPDETGAVRRLSDLLAGGPVVLFFYPAAMTKGCTQESCHFRDLAGEFADAGAQRVGISADTVEKQHQFSTRHSLGYPLLSDPDRRVAEEFGVKRSFSMLPNRRATFVIDVDRTVLEVVRSEINMNAHADKALAALHRRS
jgi:thioredoxin-dependent peroxiredoxin